MGNIKDLVGKVQFDGDRVNGVPPEFLWIGQGRSAVVYRLKGTDIAIKIFYPGYEELAHIEGEVYEKLNNHEFFPAFYEKGEGYLTMQYVEGITFYDCLVNGVAITEEMVQRVDEALEFACRLGFNPSDTHLKNILLTTDGEVKVIDVVRFTQEFDCPHWRDLKKAYETFYQRRYVPKKYPRFFIEFIIRLYRKRLLPI
ncbi:serine/threonine protein kinase [Halobacillus sp. GSS1]|uniref:serine/threonine protein kinase n=1 Tax=Halobacillus sp. GSS1 TaxID=2815919 RepID=UPI001A8D1E5D|nr:serine/threonine protein kinase [Halobacillus sp. GSS1]MBN9655445.1 serine/threonine protein kinase [Halobacillus sp. GSS1]